MPYAHPESYLPRISRLRIRFSCRYCCLAELRVESTCMAISSAVASAIICQAPQLSKKVFVVGYPLDDVYFRAVDPVDRKKIILFVGRIAREKGIELLIKALRYLEQSVSTDLSGWKVRIVGPHEIRKGGDGVEYLRELRGLAESLKCDCEFAGAIFDEHVLITEYRRAMVFVYPSLADTGEAFGLAPLEAMATGCAVVVSNLDCFDDFIDDGVNGLKFDHRSSNPEVSLALTLRRLIVEPDMMKRIVTNGTQITRRFQARLRARSSAKRRNYLRRCSSSAIRLMMYIFVQSIQ